MADRVRSGDVIKELAGLFTVHGVPLFLRSDNGPEFVAKAVQAWLNASGVKATFIESGKPWQNGVAKSLNSRFLHDCLNQELCKSLKSKPA